MSDQKLATKGKQKRQPETQASSLKWQAFILFGLLLFRLINASYVETFFQPDEYFQALEPAWSIAFGPDAGAWITWEWKEGLRTSVHPFIFSLAYKVAYYMSNVLCLDRYERAEALVIAPRVLQAIFAAIMDFFTWRSAAKIYGEDHGATPAALAITIISPWQWFCSVRPFSNSVEATLTAFAICYFPWTWFLESEDSSEISHSALSSRQVGMRWPPFELQGALMAAAIAFYIRPTNIIIWAAISGALLCCNRDLLKAGILIVSAAVEGIAVVGAFALCDYWYYGDWTFPPFRFLHLNLFQSIAVFYGTNRMDYYFSEGLPLLLTTGLPFAALGLWQSLRAHTTPKHYHIERQTRLVLSFAIVVTVLALSAIAHKEMRFIYPLLPILHMVAARPFASFFLPFRLSRFNIKQAILVALIAINIYIASYVGAIHQRGVIDVVHYLRHRQEAWFDTVAAGETTSGLANANLTIGFLMPCHSTPWRSHLVYPEINAWALTCEPPLNLTLQQRATYLDEADVFYSNPALWISSNMNTREEISTEVDPEALEGVGRKTSHKRSWPHYLVFFEHLEPTMKMELAGSNYKECQRFFNTHWIDDWRRKGDVIVWCLRR